MTPDRKNHDDEIQYSETDLALRRVQNRSACCWKSRKLDDVPSNPLGEAVQETRQSLNHPACQMLVKVLEREPGDLSWI